MKEFKKLVKIDNRTKMNEIKYFKKIIYSLNKLKIMKDLKEVNKI